MLCGMTFILWEWPLDLGIILEHGTLGLHVYRRMRRGGVGSSQDKHACISSACFPRSISGITI